MKIGNKIKELRTKRGLTQEALAAALGVTPQTVSKWECEVNFPDVSLLPDLSVFFGVSIDSLFSMTRADKFERIENRLSEGGLLPDDEVKQIENLLLESASDADGKGEAMCLLSKLYDHQAAACRKVAAAYARTAVEVTDGSPRALAAFAASHRAAPRGVIEGSHRDVISYLKGYLGRNPYSADACSMLIDSLIADCRTDEAKVWVEHLEKIDSGARPVIYKYKAATATGDDDVALAALAVLTNSYTDDAEVLFAIADIYISRAEYGKAVKYCRRSFELSGQPRDVEPILVCAHVNELIGNVDEAVGCYREAQKTLREEWGVVSGERIDAIRKEIKRISGAE